MHKVADEDRRTTGLLVDAPVSIDADPRAVDEPVDMVRLAERIMRGVRDVITLFATGDG